MDNQYWGIATAAFYSTLFFVPMIIGNAVIFKDKPLVKKLFSFWTFSLLVLGVAMGSSLFLDYFG